MTGSGVSMELSVSVSALGAAAVISMITILISAWIPAKKAVSIPVLECIRQTGEIRMEGKDVRTPKLLWKIYGLEGVLAWKNFKRNKRRYRGVIISLTFSVVLTVTGSAFNTTLKQMTRGHMTEVADGDISLIIKDLPEEEFLRLHDRLQETEGVKRSTWQINPVYTAVTDGLPDDFLRQYREGMGEDSAGSRQQIPVYTQFIEEDLYDEFLHELGLPVKEYSGPDGKVLMCAADVQEHVTYLTGSTVDFTFLSADGGQEKKVCAVFADHYPLDTTFERVPDWMFVMTVPMERKAQFDGVEPSLQGRVQRGILFWTDTPSQTLAELQNAILEEGVTMDYMIYNLSVAFDLFRNMSFVLHVFTYLFVFLISLIAVANVFNTISTNIRLRRRELAMLRSVGMSDRSFNRMMRFECAFYGMRTLQYGVPLSILLSWLIYRVLMSVEEMDMAFSFPWGALAVSMLGVFAVVFVTMIYATGRIRREHIIDGLRDELA
jgi:putative ABC transport system permease protein